MSGARVPSVMPTSRPLRSASTRIERLPFTQSSASKPEFAGALLGGFQFQIAVNIDSGALGGVEIFLRHGVVDEPGENVADAALSGFVAIVAGDDAVADDAAHALDRFDAVADQHVAGGCAHDHHHRARADHADRRDGHMGIDVGDGDGDARLQAHPGGGLCGQSARLCAQLGEIAAHLGIDHVGETGIERGEVSRSTG